MPINPPPQKKTFIQVQDDMRKVIDVDDSRGRSVPINMNFIEEGFLSKDTGVSLFGPTTTEKFHSLSHVKKKNGTSYIIGIEGSIMKKYDSTTNTWLPIGPSLGTTTFTVATPCVATKASHGLSAGDIVYFTSTGTLPTGITSTQAYYVLATGLTANDFQFSLTAGGTAINTTGAGSGTHTMFRGYTSTARFGYIPYTDELYGGNAVQSYFKWDGTTFTEYPSAPKGNILEIFEDRMFISGVTANPGTVYFSGIATPTTFAGADVLNPLGTDSVTGLENYYGQLLIFKQESIWKCTFVYDQVVSLFVQKLELQSGNYGACSRKAITWAENDIWFFTGREVRSIGYRDQQTGVLGVNPSVISDSIKETLATLSVSNFSKCSVFYSNRRFYLALPLEDSENDTVFVCHLLYKLAWTKYTDRIKAKIEEFIEIDDVIYTTKSTADYGVIKWQTSLLNDNGAAIPGEVFFKQTEDKDFNSFNIYRYLDLMFKNLQGVVTVTVRQDANDARTTTEKQFYVGETVEGEENAIAEVDFGEMLFGDSFGESVSQSPFVKKRISMLLRAQALTIGLSNSGVDETFTIAQTALFGMKEPRKMFKPSSIISI